MSQNPCSPVPVQVRNIREAPTPSAEPGNVEVDGWFSIESWMEEIIGTPRESEIALLMKSLPDASKAKYREIYKKLREAKKNGVP